jgi:guanine nucleotide-binding protein subunit alpha
MCFGGRDKDDGGVTRSRELDRLIRQDEKRMSKEVKLLLLGMSRPIEFLIARIVASAWLLTTRLPIAGAGESGKSTVLKQMKLIYAQGFSKSEKLEWKPVVFANVVQSFRLIFDAMTEMDITFENPENEVSLGEGEGEARWSPGTRHSSVAAVARAAGEAVVATGNMRDSNG